MATAAQRFQEDQNFFLRMSIWVSLFIFLAFAQFAARGMVDLPRAPVWVHLHALVFVSWLALFVMQNQLAASGSLAMHRRLGWTGVGLAVAMVALGSFAGVQAIVLHRQPPFFSPPYFLALTQVGIAFFAATVGAAIALRRETEWHRRLMLVATVMLMEPALGRLLPMPLTGGEPGEYLAMIVQLGVLLIAMRHDRVHRGEVHPALIWGACILVSSHATVSLVSRMGPVVALAERLAAG